MLNARTIQGILVLAGAMFLAVWLGQSIVTNQFETIFKVIVALTFVGCLALGRRIWLLIPFAATLGIGLRLPGQPDSLLLAQALVLGFSTILFLMRKLPFRLQISELEILAIVLTLFIAQAYGRNPVSVQILGGDMIGGKAYALYAIALSSAMLLAGLRVPERDLKWILPLGILGGLMNAAISFLGYLVPAVAYYTGASFTRSNEVDYSNQKTVADSGAATRISFLTSLGKNISLWISSFMSPLKASFHPFWGGVILISSIAVMMGGFRNGVAALGMTYFIGIAYRNGITGIIISCFGGAFAVTLLALANLIYPLPPNVQRALTFLPGTWEQRYKQDADFSTEWRVEIWKEALLTDRWIQNKWLGDGLGFSAAELNAQMSFREGTRTGISGFDAHREAILSNGDYHSGPVSLIRTIGYFGLLAFVLIQIRLAVHAHRQIIRCRGTPWLPLALFVGIPIIWSPIFFVFIYGDFKTDTPTLLLSLAMLRLLENNLPLPAYVVKKKVPFILKNQAHSDAATHNLTN